MSRGALPDEGFTSSAPAASPATSNIAAITATASARRHQGLTLRSSGDSIRPVWAGLHSALWRTCSRSIPEIYYFGTGWYIAMGFIWALLHEAPCSSSIHLPILALRTKSQHIPAIPIHRWSSPNYEAGSDRHLLPVVLNGLEITWASHVKSWRPPLLHITK